MVDIKFQGRRDNRIMASLEYWVSSCNARHVKMIMRIALSSQEGSTSSYIWHKPSSGQATTSPIVSFTTFMNNAPVHVVN